MTLTRRELMRQGAALLAGGALGGGLLAACGHGAAAGGPGATPGGAGAGAGAPAGAAGGPATTGAGEAAAPVGRGAGPVLRLEPASDTSFPYLEVRGHPYEIGHAIGSRFAAEVHAALADGPWFRELKAFVAAQPPDLHETFVSAARKHAASVYQELRGWADGSGVPLRDLMILNLRAEYDALRDQAKTRATCEVQAGCSTIVLLDGARAWLAHNEDGDRAYHGRMFLLRVHPDGKPSFLCASYPGVLPGNAPWVNDRGVAMTTNFIYTREVKVGVGRYFLDRLAMEARSVDEALAVCRHPERAYAFHHVIAALAPRRVVSLEVTPSQQSLQEVSGLWIHTNHLLHPALAATAQDPAYVGTSSLTRLRVLTKWRASADVAALDGPALIAALASHEGRPYSPCRHPAGDVRGTTLTTALFDLAGRSVRFYKGQPCAGRARDFAM